jgi:hypothetical protein
VLIGQARVSPQDQSPELQPGALTNAGCARVFVAKVSRARAAG